MTKRLAVAVTSGMLIGGLTFGGIAVAAPAESAPDTDAKTAEVVQLENDLAQAQEALKQAEEELAAQDAEAPAKLAAAQEDVDAAQAAVQAAEEALANTKSTLDEATEKQEAAQKDLDSKTAAAEKATSERDAAKKAYDDAVAERASDEQIAALKSDVDAKQEALDSAKKKAEDAKAKADNVKKDAAAAQVAVDDAQAKADAAKKAADEAAAKQQEAEKQRDDAQQAVTQAEGALQAAETKRTEACAPVKDDPAVKAAQQKLDEARSQQDEKQKAVDTAQKNAEQVLKDEQQGTAGFFRWLGVEKNDPDATRAYELLTTGKYTDASGNSYDVSTKVDDYGPFFAETELNKTGDATTLKNLKATLPHIDRGNELRRNDDIFPGRADLKINSLLMAGSELQTNAANTVIGHRPEVIQAENLAWGHSDPYNGWYTKEKNLYKQEPVGHKSGTGHYKNLMNDTYAFTGFAVVDKQGTLHGIAHGQVFDLDVRYYTDSTAPSYTTAEYGALIGEYESTLRTARRNFRMRRTR